MLFGTAVGIAAAALTSCAQLGAPPVDAVAALRPFYERFDAPLPTAGDGVALPEESAPLSHILFGSCHTAEAPIPILRTIASEPADLFVYLGDNVYGDTRGDMSLPELRAQYQLLSSHPDFRALRATHPMIATWDDHDYGLNDAGGDFSAREYAKRIFETFWGTGARTSNRDGVYDAYVFGPEGQRVQIILLDTRSARSPLTRLPQRGARGPYGQSDDVNQRMLSDTQWRWLASQLRRPADIRIIASSIQVLADGHDFEAWETLPREQMRLLDTIRSAQARGVLFVSGDRHIAGLYRQEGLLPYAVHELTTSSLNLSFRDTSDERSSNQIGDMYAPVNYGAISFDWGRRELALQIKNITGEVVREQRVTFHDIGL
jgi:alkaline phosphatase D